jgi:recombination protein RecA
MAKEKVKKEEIKVEKTMDMDAYFNAIDKKMGGGVIKRADDDTLKIRRLSTGIPSLDRSIGGGIPVSKWTQFKGPEHCGKSWACLRTIANLHKNDKSAWAVYLDVEKSFDPKWATQIGVDMNRLKVITDLTSEGFWDLLSRLLDNPTVKIIVLDSLAVMVPKDELVEDTNGVAKGFEKKSVGTQAQTNTVAVRIVNNKMKYNSAAIIVINQVRYKIGVMYGNPETTPGGMAVKHQLSVDLQFRKGDRYPEKCQSEDAKGHVVNTRATKNKTYKEQQVSSFIMMTDGSVNEVAGILAMAKELNYLEESGIKKGNSYIINGEKVAGKISDFEEYLMNNNEAFEKIRKEVEELASSEGNKYELDDLEVEDLEEAEDEN